MMGMMTTRQMMEMMATHQMMGMRTTTTRQTNQTTTTTLTTIQTTTTLIRETITMPTQQPTKLIGVIEQIKKRVEALEAHVGIRPVPWSVVQKVKGKKDGKRKSDA